MSPNERSRLVTWHRELTIAHTRLREALLVTQQSIEDPRAASRDLLLYCVGFCAALGGHHRSEDEGLFPVLVARHPELRTTISKLRQDHDMISYLLGRLENAVRSTSASPEELTGHLEGIAAIMESHFRYEERQLHQILASLDLDAPVEEMLGPL